VGTIISCANLAAPSKLNARVRRVERYSFGPRLAFDAGSSSSMGRLIQSPGYDHKQW